MSRHEYLQKLLSPLGCEVEDEGDAVSDNESGCGLGG